MYGYLLINNNLSKIKKIYIYAYKRSLKNNQHKWTAGIFLLIRSSPLIEYSSTVLLTCLWLGAITTLFSSIIGLYQQDIKKLVAYSTMSQLGIMVIAIGLSSYNIALFHLVNHAFPARKILIIIILWGHVKFDCLLESLQQSIDCWW